MAALFFVLVWMFVSVGLSPLGATRVFRLGIDLVFMLASLSGYILLSTDWREEDHVFTRFKNLFLILYLVFSFSMVSTFSNGSPRFGSLSFVSLSLSFLGAVFLNWYFFRYIVSSLKLETKVIRLCLYLSDITSSVFFVFLVLNLITRYFFQMDDSGYLVRHIEYYSMFSIPAALYYVVGILVVYRMDMEKKKKYLTILYFLFPAAGLLVGTVYHSVTVPCACGLLVFLLMYTGLSNRRGEDVIVTEEKLVETEQKEKDTEQKILLSQIQPHFIFNTLSVIAALTKKSPELASQVTKDFAAYLDDNLNVISDNPVVLFSKELAHVEKYVNIQKVRFGEDLTVLYDIGPREFPVPSLSIQPLVENAIIHGIIRGKQEAGTVKLSTREDNENYLIVIEDDGIGFDPDKVEHNDGRVHVGLANSRERIQNLVHGRLEVSSVLGQGTVITIYISKTEVLNG
ncbi:MAG: histidine kinase [Spirochaetales bacterium]|nr:histidine kinase [Candidatus Physcosoma equi]